MELNFERDAYGPGNKASAQLKLATLDKQALAKYGYRYILSLDGKEYKKGTGKTDTRGLAIVGFDLPKDLKTNDALLNILINYKGQTESISRSVPIVLGNIDLQFFPEGGELLQAMRSNIGFKAVDEFGKAADISGIIVDEMGNQVSKFSSYHKGMGSFEFRPLANKSYSALILQPSTAKGSYPLPKAIDKGISLRLRGQTKHQLQLDILASQAEELFVVAQTGSAMQFSYTMKAYEGVNSLTIPTGHFPLGISQITVFDSKKLPRAERLVFINQHKSLNIKVSTNKEQYLPRELVEMKIEVSNELGQPVAGQFSVAVVEQVTLKNLIFILMMKVTRLA